MKFIQRTSKDDPIIEGLRGWAALMVVATHFARFVTPDPGSWAYTSTGVDLFFVLSGYVFAPYFFDRPLDYRTYLIRRVCRLYPLYACALALYVALKPADEAFRHFWVHIGMMHTLQNLEIAFYYNPAFWSLPPEVEFYLCLPLLIWVSKKIGFMPLLLLALLMKVMLVAGATAQEVGITARAIATVHLPGLLVEFLFGVWAYDMAHRLSSKTRWCLMALGLAFIGLAWGLFTYALTHTHQPAGSLSFWAGAMAGLTASFAYMLCVSAIAHRAVLPQQMRVCQWGGQVSYGTYLFHNAVPSLLAPWLGGGTGSLNGWLNALICLMATILVAWVLHHLVEAPCRNWAKQFRSTSA